MAYTYKYPHPAVTVDACIFAAGHEHAEILLIRRGVEPSRGAWALPGGFVEIDEELETAIAREVEEETGVTGVSLEQFQAFGKVDRDPRERIISVAYFGFVDADRVTLQAGTDASDAGWFDVDKLPELAFDHAEIIAVAVRRTGVDSGGANKPKQFDPS